MRIHHTTIIKYSHSSHINYVSILEENRVIETPNNM